MYKCKDKESTSQHLTFPWGQIMTHYDLFVLTLDIDIDMFYLMSTFLARGRQEDSPDWLRYKSGKGAEFL